MFRKLMIIIVLGLTLTGSAFAQKMASSASLFTDLRSREVGQGLTVLVMEYSQASNDARTESQKQSDHNIGISAGSGLFDFLPDVNLSGNLQNDFRGDARTSKQGALKAKIAARIVGKNEVGDYVIEGRRVIEINSEQETYVLSGAVRSQDIMADNTVYSYNIYDAHIVYKGKGEVSRAQKAGFLTRLLQWVF
ncbi:MAG: flagellar basal body L-ring protein FlgH [Calditrichia bacterium]